MGLGAEDFAYRRQIGRIAVKNLFIHKLPGYGIIGIIKRPYFGHI
jgi:hypothetical protein